MIAQEHIYALNCRENNLHKSITIPYVKHSSQQDFISATFYSARKNK
jgi:hypothetical protein